MCKFFSSVSDGKGKFMYFDSKLRKECLSGKLNYEPDSHTSIADYFGYKGAKEDSLNKYEYSPLTKNFQIDQLNTKDDSEKIKDICLNLDFKKIVPELIIKPIVHPFQLNTTKVYKKDITLLKSWASVWDSVGASVWASAGASVRDSLWASVWASVRDSLWDSVWASVGASVRDSVWASVRDSLWDSVWASVGASVRAYTSSYFNIKQWEYVEHKKGANPFQSAIDLWERGLVPSFDGKLWRLHGKDGKILWGGVRL